MGTDTIVIVSVGPQDPAKMRFAQDHDVIQAFSADRADEAFNVSVLPRRLGCGWSIPDAHRSDPATDDGAVGAVSVADEITGRLFPWEGFGELAGDPFRRRVGGSVCPNQLTAMEINDHETIEQLEAHGRNDKQIDSGNVRGVIAEKCLPAL